MISVPDLCIGNWVYDGERTQFPMYIQTIGDDYVYLNFEGNEGDVFESTPEDLQGIPIAEGILTRNGFKEVFNRDKTCFSKACKISDKRHIQVSFSLDCGSMSIVDITENKFPDACLRLCSYTTNIKFLHEMQNFYRMTTKQELKVNLWK